MSNELFMFEYLNRRNNRKEYRPIIFRITDTFEFFEIRNEILFNGVLIFNYKESGEKCFEVHMDNKFNIIGNIGNNKNNLRAYNIQNADHIRIFIEYLELEMQQINELRHILMQVFRTLNAQL